jgi:hypothetical protein
MSLESGGGVGRGGSLFSFSSFRPSEPEPDRNGLTHLSFVYIVSNMHIVKYC